MTIKNTLRLSVIIAIAFSAHFSYAQTGYMVRYSTQLQPQANGSGIFESENDTSRFTEGLYQRLISGTLKVTDADPQTKEDKTLTPDQVRQRFELIDTMIVINPVTRQEKTSIIKTLRKISSIRCNEEWAFDKAGHFTKRIKSYIVCAKNFDSQGNYKQEEALVKVWNDAK